jgi:hypothetical protein
LGINDSVKTIKLSNNDTLKLSKSFGIIQFPNLFGIGNYYMVGIENRNMGEKVPDFWDIFNFNVGDVFQYNGNYTDGGMFVIDDYVKKYDILSKTISTNKITYQIHLIQNGVRHWMDPYLQYWTPYVNNNNENLEIDIPSNSNCDADKIVNKFNNQKHTPANCGPYYSYRTILTVDSLNIFTKTIGGFDSSSFYSILNSYMSCDSIPDMFHLAYGNVIEGATFAEYKVGLGRTAIIAGCFEINGDEFLEGYIKNGDTVGVITPDDTLLGLTKNATNKQNYITLSPNPFSEKTTIKIIDKNVDLPCILSIYNIQGQLMRIEEINNKTYFINRGLLQNGMYLYSIQDATNNLIGKGKLIIQ